MNKGIIGFIVGIIAVIGGAFVATMLLKDKIFKKDDEDEDYDLFDDVVDDDEFESFFDDDSEDIPEVSDEDLAEDEGEEEKIVDDSEVEAEDEQL